MLPIRESREDCGESNWQSRAPEGDQNYPSCTTWCGQLIFIGRHVHRGLDDDSLTIGVDPKFLNTMFTEFNITKGSSSVPDVAGILDKAMGDKNLLQELTSFCILPFPTCFGQTALDGSIETRSQALPEPHWKSASQTESRHGICNSRIAEIFI